MSGNVKRRRTGKGRYRTASLPGAQFEVNPVNLGGAYALQSTGARLWHDTVGQVDIFGVRGRTGGTHLSTGTYLRGKNPTSRRKVISHGAIPHRFFLSGGSARPHRSGESGGFIPKVLDTHIYDIHNVDNEAPFATARC